jgi:autotransporter family porin
VIRSLWGNLSDNQATLTSTGTTFILKDNLEDVWGEVSAGGERLQSHRLD